MDNKELNLENHKRSSLEINTGQILISVGTNEKEVHVLEGNLPPKTVWYPIVNFAHDARLKGKTHVIIGFDINGKAFPIEEIYSSVPATPEQQARIRELDRESFKAQLLAVMTNFK